eukprot:3459840-Rhodomonas_salina.2
MDMVDPIPFDDPNPLRDCRSDPDLDKDTSITLGPIPLLLRECVKECPVSDLDNDRSILSLSLEGSARSKWGCSGQIRPPQPQRQVT